MKKHSLLFIEDGMGFGGAVVCISNILSVLNRDEFGLFVITTHKDVATREIFEKLRVSFKYVKYFHRPKIFSSLISKAACLGPAVKIPIILFVTLIDLVLNIPFMIKVVYYAHRTHADLVISNNLIDLTEIIAAKLSGKPFVVHLRCNQYASVLTKFFIKHVYVFIAISEYLRPPLKIQF